MPLPKLPPLVSVGGIKVELAARAFGYNLAGGGFELANCRQRSGTLMTTFGQ